MDSQALFDLLAVIRDLAVQLGLVIARPLGLVTVFPVFTRVALGQMLRLSLAGAMSLPLLAPLEPELAVIVAGGVGANVAVALKELGIGPVLGVLLGLPLWAAISAGDIIDNQRELGNSEIEAMGQGGQVTPMAGLLGMSAITLFLVAGGGLVIC
ncbi:MAG: flagellar biosynthetic protein FliR [Roseinatronobacter sp.]